MGEGGDGSLPVRAGNVQRRKAPFRMAERGAERLHVLQAQLDPEVLEREKTV